MMSTRQNILLVNPMYEMETLRVVNEERDGY